VGDNNLKILLNGITVKRNVPCVPWRIDPFAALQLKYCIKAQKLKPRFWKEVVGKGGVDNTSLHSRPAFKADD
jgi:hypothetical protein